MSKKENFERQPHMLLDEFAKHQHLHNDAQISRALRLNPSQTSRVRYGLMPVSDMVRVRVMRITGWTIRHVDRLAPPDNHVEII